jgi:hypothetical protein
VGRLIRGAARFHNNNIQMNMPGHFVLGPDHELIKVDVYDKDGQLNIPMLMKWGECFEDFSQRKVGQTTVGPYNISTVFLGLDHNYGDGPPLVFETIIFDGEHVVTYELFRGQYFAQEAFGGSLWRYPTWDDAVAGHAKAVAFCEQKLADATAEIEAQIKIEEED